MYEYVILTKQTCIHVFCVISCIHNVFTIRNPYKGTMGKIAERFVDRILRSVFVVLKAGNLT